MTFLLSCIFLTQANLSSFVCYSYEKKLIDESTDTMQIIVDSSMAISDYGNLYEDFFWVNKTPVKVVPSGVKMKKRKTIVVKKAVYDGDGIFFLRCSYQEYGSSEQRDVYFDFENKEMVFFRNYLKSSIIRDSWNK